jgi:hypothetical protein
LELRKLAPPKSKEEAVLRKARMKATRQSALNSSIHLTAKANPTVPMRLSYLSPLTNQSNLYGVVTDVFNARSKEWTQSGTTVERLYHPYGFVPDVEPNFPIVYMNGLEFHLFHNSMEWRHAESTLNLLFSEFAENPVIPALGSWSELEMYPVDSELYDSEEQESRWTFRPLTVENGVITMARFDLKYKNTVSNTNEFYVGSLIVKMSQSPSYVEYEFIPRLAQSSENAMFVNIHNFDSERQVGEIVSTGYYTTNRSALTDEHLEIIDFTETNYGSDTATQFNSVVARIMNSSLGIFQTTIQPKRS